MNPRQDLGSTAKSPAAWVLAATLATLLSAAPGGPALAEAADTPGPPADADTPPETDAEPEGLAYQTELQGLGEDQDALRKLLRDSSQLIALADRPPPTEAALRRRAKDDVERLLKALRSEGFYDAAVSFEIRTPDDADAERTVALTIEPGPVYLLARLEIEYAQTIAPEVRQAVPRGPDDFGLKLGARARAPEIRRAQTAILDRLETNGYPDAEVMDRAAVIDPDQKTMRVIWEVQPGPFLRFGRMRVAGLDAVEAKYARSFRTWATGEIYDRRKVDETRRQLVATGLFEGIQVENQEPSDGRLPIRFTFQERAHRSIGFGASFSTSTGPSGSAFWEHRNAFGQAERIRLELETGLIEQRFSADLRKPRFQRDDQDLLSETEILRHETDAFEELSLSTTLALEREFDDAWTGTIGGSAEITQLDDNEGRRTFFLVGVPARAVRDTRDDPLNPTEGTRLELATTPYLATLEQTVPFLRTRIGGSAYHAIGGNDRFVLAGRARVGSIVGSETEDIPASKRFFAGGGGSVRGFPFEEVGPLDTRNDPLGGRSLVELGVELRVKVTDSIGIVPFLDAGNVYDQPYPDFAQDDPLRFGAGLGVRYFTGIGPLRLDVAVPLNERPSDNSFEFYISLGQAF